jgi:hypothetical protein
MEFLIYISPLMNGGTSEICSPGKQTCGYSLSGFYALSIQAEQRREDVSARQSVSISLPLLQCNRAVLFGEELSEYAMGLELVTEENEYKTSAFKCMEKHLNAHNN